MRKYIIFTALAAVAIMQAACYGDKGSYDYKDINEIEFVDFPTSINVLYKSDSVKITPELKSSLEKDESAYEYEWKAVPDISNANPGGVISTDRNLDYFVELLPGKYFLYLKVRDKTTGVLWIKYTALNVSTAIGRGFLLLGEKEDGYTGLDMVAMTVTDTVVLTQLLENNGLPPLKGPKFIMHTGSSTPFNEQYIRLVVATDDGSYYINSKTFEGDPEFNFRDRVYSSLTTPDRLDPVYMLSKTNTGRGANYRVAVCSNGDAFFANLFNGEFYPNQLNRTKSDLNDLFPLFPYVFSATGYVNGFAFYDTRNNRFLRMGVYDEYCVALADGPADIFPWNQPAGRTLVYGENTMNKDGGGNGNSFALMKDADGSHHIYKFHAYNTISKRGYAAIDNSIATSLSQAKLFAFSSKRTLLFYAVGSTLYAYDYNKDNERLYQVEMKDEITMIKFDIQANSSYNDLYVATYNPTTKGTLQKFVLGDDPNKLGLEADENCHWDGLVKIVSMDWRDTDK